MSRGTEAGACYSVVAWPMRLTMAQDGRALGGPCDVRAPAEPCLDRPLSAEPLPRSRVMTGSTQQRAEVLEDVL